MILISCDIQHMLPPRCCRRIITLSTGQSLMEALDDLNPALGAHWRAKAAELEVPPSDRLYCPDPCCAAFLGSSTVSQFHQCPSCSERVCLICKERHVGIVKCPSQLSLEKELIEITFRKLSRKKMWRSCPGCGVVVERVNGCRHILCNCRSEFCYGCGSKWKECHGMCRGR
ncbi:hypothetical protein BDP27DRAFT_1238878 [Rhodocollybia butyracea]|uniref:RBR-type E3 ubiquitin transferase n=1 Tax=Rhodocollybia butyracea TaxID=206335 RepID=A0A9P5P9S6_9AGAR|nr:hypothetical protein BDP27DRAFT_1238878 [Rhodocollybia butyracea]